MGAKETDAVIFSGDFNLNALQSTDSYKLLIDNFNDTKDIATVKINDNIGTGAGFTNIIPPFSQRIDYVFTKNVKVNKYNVITDLYNGIFPSDHLPVVVNCEL
jgi:endonuclease/exonuclease/phosphatase family metal-dependent hydrolase